MNWKLMMLLKRLHNEAGADGSDAGGTGVGVAEAVLAEDDDDAYLRLSAEERSRLRGDTTSEPLNPEVLAAVVASGDGEAQNSGSGATDPDDGEAAAEKGGGIPRARFNEVNERRKALENEVEHLRAQLGERAQADSQGAAPGAMGADQLPSGVASAYDFEAAEERYLQLVMDGDTKSAAKLRMEINGAVEEAAYSRFTQTTAAQQETVMAQRAVTELLQVYPWLDDPEGAEALELIEASVLVKVSRGVPRAQALTDAVNAIAPRFAPSTHPSKGVQPEALRGDMRVQRANVRGAMDSQLQPAQLQAGLGNRATAPQIDANKLTDEEYEALPEAERKKLRGDSI